MLACIGHCSSRSQPAAASYCLFPGTTMCWTFTCLITVFRGSCGRLVGNICWCTVRSASFLQPIAETLSRQQANNQRSAADLQQKSKRHWHVRRNSVCLPTTARAKHAIEAQPVARVTDVHGYGRARRSQAFRGRCTSIDVTRGHRRQQSNVAGAVQYLSGIMSVVRHV